MANDNTLGAPTEGLGQTVTFTANGSKGAPQTTASQRGRLQVGLSGNQSQASSRALAIPEAKQDPTFAALAKLGGDMLKPHIEAERNASFMRGVQQASQQQAITEIVDEQPWYSKLFGATSLVDGARAYTASTSVNAMAVKVESSMADLRKLTADEFTKYSTNLLDSAKTGDDATDMMVQQQFFAAAPNLMKAQAKAHLQYQGEVLGERLGDNLDAASSLHMTIDSAVREGKTREGPDLIESATAVQAALTKPTEISQDHFDKLVTDRLVSQISNGNFALADLTEEYVKKLPAQSQYMIQRARNQATIEARGKLPASFWEQRAAFLSMSNEDGMTSERQEQARKDLQTTYERLTGDRQSFVSGNEMTQEFMQRQAHQARVAEEAKRAGMKGLAEDVKFAEHQAEVNGHVLRITNPVPGKEEYLSQLPAKMQQEVFDTLAKSVPMELRVKVLAVQSRAGVYDESLKQELAIAINTARDLNDPEKLAQAYSIYNSIVQATGDRNNTVAQDYLTKDTGRIMARYANISKGGQPTAANIGVWHAYAVLPGGTKLEGKQDAALLDSVKTDGFMKALYAAGRMFGGDTYPVADPDGLATLLKRRENPDILNADERAAAALNQSNDLTVIGGTFWERSSKSTDLLKYLNSLPASVDGVASDNVHRATNTYFTQLADTLRIDGDFKIVQLPDAVGGVPQMAMVGKDSSNQFINHPFTAADIAAKWTTRKEDNAVKLRARLADQQRTDLRSINPANRPK